MARFVASMSRFGRRIVSTRPTTTSSALGGSGLTAALAAAHYGAQVSLAGWVGAAEAGELLDEAGPRINGERAVTARVERDAAVA